MQGVSQLKIYSIGVAAQNLPLNTDMLEVFCQEDHPMADGEISDNSNEYKSEGSSADSGSYEVKMDTTISIKAKWMAIGEPNRQTPPNVRRGEQVVIYRFGESNDYYWLTTRSDLKFRKLETVIYGFSGTSEEGAEPNGDNTYFFEVSTHKKIVRLVTSMKNGEPFRYNIELNTGLGQFKIEDNVGNFLLLDSKAKQFRYENVSTSFMDIIDKMMTISIPDSIGIKTKDMSVDVKTLKFNGETVDYKATTTNMQSTTTHKGNLTLQGSFAASGGGARSGGSATFDYPVSFKQGISVKGNVGVSGNISATGSITGNPVNGCPNC